MAALYVIAGFGGAVTILALSVGLFLWGFGSIVNASGKREDNNLP